MKIDAVLSPEVRVRTWHQPDADVPRWPAGAHETVELAWVEDGGLTYEIDGRAMIVPRGSALLVPPGVEHRTAIAPMTRAGSLHLAFELFAGVAGELGARVPDRETVIARAAEVVALARCLAEEATGSDLGRGLASESIAEAIVVRALRASTPRSTPVSTERGRDPRIRRAVEHLESALDETLSVEALARTARMSRFHFSRTFKQELGLSPHQYLMRARVLRAAELLRAGDADVTGAAISVGFADLGRFSRTFRRWVGCAPSELKSAS